ncbi:MAG: PAS domain-containing protein [Fimbriimonadaceae bacterium]
MRNKDALPRRPMVEPRGIDSAGIKALSRREDEVLSLAASGYLDKEICSQLGVSPNTLRTYWSRIRKKIGEAPRSALAVAYATDSTTHAVVDAGSPDWEVDLDRWTYRRLSPRQSVVEADVGEEISFDDAIAIIHPEDAPNLLRLIEEIRHGHQSDLTFEVRVVTPIGIETTGSFVRVERGEDGHATRLIGTRSHNVDLRATGRPEVEVGYWERDLRTDKFTADDEFCRIFRIDPGDPDLRDVAMKRFHPAERQLTSTFVSSAVASNLRHARATHRLLQPDGSYRWITTDLRVEYDAKGPTRALGVVMAFDRD